MTDVQMSRLSRRLEELAAVDRVAIEDTRGACTFIDLAVWSESLSTTSWVGQRVGLLTSPERRWLVGFLAILRSGGSVVPLTSLYPHESNVTLLRRAGVRAVVTTSEHGNEFRAAGFAVSEIEPLPPSTTFRPSSAPDETRLSASPVPTPAWGPHSLTEQSHDPSEAENQEAILLFTSGTTGEPKLVPHTHQSIFDGVCVLATAWGFDSKDVLVHMLPLHHLHGICVALLQSFLSGATTRLLPRFDVPSLIDACDGASVLMGVPTQYHKLLAYLQTQPEPEVRRVERILRGLRLVTSGSAKLPEAMGQRLCALTGQYPLERYGMTEVGIVLSNPLHGERRPGSAGQPLPGVNVRIIGDDGRDVDSDGSGELCIAAPSVFRGYDDNGGASEDAFVGGYFRTGDTARWLPGGFVQLLGRTSVDIIKSGGEKLSALELEEMLRAHPSIDEVAVVGLPDETWGEAATAAVITKGAVDDQFEALTRRWCKERTAPFKVPRRIVVVDDLPRNALGKVNKPELIARLLADDS